MITRDFRDSIENEFYQGRYRGVLARSVDGAQPDYKISDLSWIIGALSFLGRMEEAELLFEKRSEALGLRERIQARFFLGIGFSRQSQYVKARSHFGKNLREDHARLRAESIFFLYQGLAFNRYFSGRFRAAEKASARAFEVATESDYLYGKLLSADIRGHILVQRGEISRGLEILRQAKKYSELLGSSAVSDAIEISVLVYGAEHGLNPQQDLKTLNRALKSLSPQDTYSKSSLMLELARQYLLRGRPGHASGLLDQAAELIYASQNRRNEVLLNLRYANQLLHTGEAARALSFLRLAKKSLDLAVDHALELSTLGLERKILKRLGQDEVLPAIEKRLVWMSSIYGSAVQKRITERDLRIESQGERRREDRLGLLRDEVEAKAEGALQRVLDFGYNSFLFELLDVSPSTRLIFVELLPGTLTLFDRGEVRHSDGFTHLSRALAIQIAQGLGSKKQLVEKIWGHAYHPLRHDSIVYAAMTTFRKLLGDRAQWIETTEEGYRFSAGVQLRLPDSRESTAAEAIHNPWLHEGLNLRQLKILRYLEKNEAIDVKTCRALFKASEITASRDLSALNRARLVVRVGRGRATKYLLRSPK